MNSTFRNLCIALLVAAALSGCRWGCSSDDSAKSQQGTYEQPDPLAMVVKHRFDTSSNQIKNQVTQTLDYASIPYSTYDLTLGESTLDIPESVKLIYMTTERVEQLNKTEIDKLIRFVAQGKQIVFLRPVYDERFAYFLGIKRNARHRIDTTAEGFSFKENVFPSYKGQSFTNQATFIHGGFTGTQFVSDKNVIASAATDDSYPVIIQRDIGKGRSIYFNTMVMSEKNYRGLLFSVGLKALQGYPYRVANVSTIFLDDFPAPLYDTKLAPIDEEYDTTHANFVTRIWWPDMKALADSFNIDYSAMLTFNYNAVVVPPYDFKEWEASRLYLNGKSRNASAWMAKEIANSRHELAFHGYNHFSLWEKDWANMQFMQASLQAAKKRWTIDNLGSFPVTYVPPTNNIDSLGLQAITSTMPSIKYMSSIYLGDFEEGGGREFSADPLAPELFDYPRITSGFVNTEASNFNQNSLSLYTGIWTHFIHPDDVFQVNQRTEDDFRSRNPLGLGWKSDEKRDYGLHDVFKERLEETEQRYPFTRYLSAQEAGPIVQRWVNTRTYYEEGQSHLSVTDQSTKQQLSENKQKFWFAYVADDNSSQFEESLSGSDIRFRKSPLWQGSLYQFKSSADTLRVPIFDTAIKKSQEIASRAITQYQQFMSTPEPDTGTADQWRDNRLQEALAALSRNPTSRQYQDSVISLAVEFDSTQIAISVLERRLMNNPTWRTEDIERLLKYYGWESAIDRAYKFADKLWQKYTDNSVLMFQDMIASRYGVPGPEVKQKWLLRKYEKNPRDPEVLRQMMQNAENWSERKNYLTQLIDSNPQSDSLYGYAVQQSVYYADAGGTIDLVQSFPDSQHVDKQLEPFADQLAYRYADQNQLTRAILWGQKTDQIPPITQLSWLMQQQRYHDFIERSNHYLQESPQNDSLRTFVGQQLIYQNFRDRGYNILYPLFEQDKAPAETKELVHSEIGYMSYEEQKSFYKEYPAFFSDNLRSAIKRKYRQNEGFKGGSVASYSNDNFNNNTGEFGLFAEWGNRPLYNHRITVSDRFVSSGTAISSWNNLSHIGYRFERNFDSQTSQLTVGGGIYGRNQGVRPELHAGYWYSQDSSYTSANLQFQPVFTNTAITQKINQFKATFYREDYWLNNNRLQTALTLAGTAYNNENLSYESTGRLFVVLPFSTQLKKVKPLVELSYANAKTPYSSGVPYYTPDNLFGQGVGVDLSYQDMAVNPDFSAGIELMAKRNNRDGLFFTGSARLTAEINNYWDVSLNGYMSTSKVYRYNSINVGISYILPKKLTP